MKRFLMIIPFIVLLGVLSQAAEENVPLPAAIRILDVADGDVTRETLFGEFTVLDDLGDFLVARPETSDPGRIAELGISSIVVAVPARSGLVYIASVRANSLDAMAAAGVVLYAQGDIALVATTTPEKLQGQVPHYGLENGYRPLSLTVVKPAPVFKAPVKASGNRAADPRITAMVSQVDATNLQNVVQDMQDMGERKANSGGFVAETYLVNAFSAIPGLIVSTHQFSSSYSDNVIAELPGIADPSVIYVIGGHYDSASYSGGAPGADDNATGTSGVLEIARILSQYQFKYTIRFCAFGAEELGLVGSDAYCDDLVTWGDNIDAMINLDMTCYRYGSEPRDVGFVTNYSSSSLINFCIGQFTTYVPSLGITQGSLSGGTSDHQSFTQHGFTACFPFEDLNNYSPYIHTTSDVIGTSANDFTLSRWITQGALASLAELAAPVDLDIVHASLADTNNVAGPYRIDADVSSLIGTNVDTVTLYYDVGGGFVARQMVPSGTGDGYVSSIPGLFGSGTVKYYIEAVDDQGYSEQAPGGIGSGYYQFYVGDFAGIWSDDFEISDNGWTHGGSGQDDWMRDVPTGNGGYDPADAFSGTKIWGNDLGPSGYNGNYQSNVNNWLESPNIDCSGQTGVHLRYRRWLTVEKGQYDQAKILVNGNTVWQNDLSSDHIDIDWELHEIDISAYADNNPNVKLRFTLTTNGSNVFGGWNIDDLKVGMPGSGYTPDLYSGEVYFHAATGGSVAFNLNGDPSQSGRYYMLALSASGTSPGTQVGPINIPLNRDQYTDLVLQWYNKPVFANFVGKLNGAGDASATFNPPVITNPALIGAPLHFAWFTFWPVDYASIAVEILIAP